jgi:putative Holliday junction resolvase
MDGTQGIQADKTRAFVENLSRHIEVPVEYRDERLTTVSAREMMQEAGKKKRDTRYDAAAAALILQSYLDEIAGTPPDTPAPPEK